MARRQQPPQRYHQRSQARPSPLQIAISGATVIRPADVQRQISLTRAALASLMQASEPEQCWKSLADTANMAETLAGMGLGAGPQATQVIADAQATLHDVFQRARRARTWAMTSVQIDTLRWLIDLHAVQLAACSYGEFERALRSTQRRIFQAAQGNASPGKVVVVGDVV